MKRIFGILTILLILPFMPALAQNGGPHPPTGRITGKVVDGETGEPIIGARVVVEGIVPTIGAVSDLNGNYTLRNVPPGSHTVVVTYPEYARMVVTGVPLAENEIRQEDISLKHEIKQVEGEVVEVVARASRGSSAGLLKDRQKAAAVSDAIGAEEMSRTGSSDAAQAMSRVTGATVVGGKYVYVRGLGERYSTTQLNGAELPSTDPNRRAVHLDLFAANLLENIVTVKSYTPDKPGNFTGGSVNLVTKSYPDKFGGNFSISSSYNSQVNLKDGFLTSPGGKSDWLGMDDGTRDIPDYFKDPNYIPPAPAEALRDTAKARELDQASKAFNSHMAPSRKQAPLNRNFSLSLGDQIEFLGRPLGLSGSLSYTREFNSYTGGQVGRWRFLSSGSGSELTPDILVKDAKSSDEVVWGGLANLAFLPHPKHELKANYMYNRSGESMARYLAGDYQAVFPSGDLFESRVLQYTERALGSLQLSGHHFIDPIFDLDLNWNGSLSRSSQAEPDLRFFSNIMSVDSSVSPSDTVYSIRSDGEFLPSRFFRKLNEENLEFNLDFSVPFKQWNGLAGKLKLGGGHLGKDRSLKERLFRIGIDQSQYDGDPEYFFSDTVMGINEQAGSGGFTRFGNYVSTVGGFRGYSADRNVSALFGMMDFPLWRKLRFAGGFRFEADRTNIFLNTSSGAIPVGRQSNDDWLPSANLVYQLGKDLNLRASYSRTLARPEFRELANYVSYDFLGGFRFIGNPNLQRTRIHNYDLRGEWFARPGEILSVSGFYKRFLDPIERVLGQLDDITVKNSPIATAYGLEFEARKRLDQFGSFLQNFQMGANLTLVHSEVDFDSAELADRRASDPNASATRPLQGQSPYIVNLDLSYSSFKTGTTASLLYNVFGRRLSEVNRNGNPDVYEESRGQFDFTFSQKFWKVLTFKVSAKNLLDSEFSKVYAFKGKKYPYEVYKKGRSISAGFSWAID